MMKRIAVVIRGHYRTWKYNHKMAFKFYDSIAENVDYYFVSWRLPTFSIGEMLESFEECDKKLVKYLLLYPNEEFYTGWVSPGWFNYNILPYMRKRMRDVGEYDMVVDTRPDIIYTLKDLPPAPILPNTLYTTDYVLQKNMFNHDELHIGVEDHLFMSDFDTYVTMNMRYIEKDDIGCHNVIQRYAIERGINTAVLDWVSAEIVRPNVISEVPNPENYFKYTDVIRFAMARKWTELSKEEKLAILKKHAIPAEDYNTNSANAKL